MGDAAGASALALAMALASAEVIGAEAASGPPSPNWSDATALLRAARLTGGVCAAYRATTSSMMSSRTLCHFLLNSADLFLFSSSPSWATSGGLPISTMRYGASLTLNHGSLVT